MAALEGFQPVYFLYILALLGLYEALRCAQWGLLLQALGARVPRRTLVFTFLGGEIAESLPVGTYFRNYLLQRSTDTTFGRSSAATTLSMVTEVAICLAGIVLLGLGDWSIWLRPLILIGLVLFLLLSVAIRRVGRRLSVPPWLRACAWYRRVATELGQFRAGAATLLQPHVLLQQGLLGILYLGVAGAVLYMVLLGLGLDDMSYGEALAVYLFGLGVALISPVPMDIGVIEVSGVGALVAVGVTLPAAVGAMLVNRLLRTGTQLLLALAAFLLLRDELRAALRN
jgi:uncharacterized protein (TIRG00374 family)